MIYMCLMDYADRDAIAAVRPEHRLYLQRLFEEGRVVAAGSFLPNDDGGLFLYEASSLEEAQQMVDDDPYLRAGVIRSHRLAEYEIHGINPALLRVSAR